MATAGGAGGWGGGGEKGRVYRGVISGVNEVNTRVEKGQLMGKKLHILSANHAQGKMCLP